MGSVIKNNQNLVDYGACQPINYCAPTSGEARSNPHDRKRPASSCIRQRYLLTFLAFLGFFVSYSLRVNLSVGLVAMVNNSAVIQNETRVEECPPPPNPDNTTAKYEQDGEFVWDENIQGIILGAFFYGYVGSLLLSGFLIEKFSPKQLFGAGLLLTSLLTLVTPFAARLHYYALIAIRILEGIGEGVTIPSWCAIISRWSPRHEQSTLLAMADVGCQAGTIVVLPLAALLCEIDYPGYANGWPLVFYVFGGVGCLWFVIWMLVTTDTPEEHKWVSEKELTYIILNRPSTGQKKSIPWKSILTSVPVWALGLCRFCTYWGFYTLLTDLPTYMNMSLQVSISKNGFLNSLLYIAQGLSGMTSGLASDILRVKGYLKSTSTTRKLFELFALTGPAICLALVPHFGCDHLSVVCLLVVAAAMQGLTSGGDGPNPVDIAPDYAGVISGLTNGCGNLSGFLAPMAVGRLTLHHNDMKSWSKVFYLSSGIYVLGLIVFLSLGTGNIQPWGVSSRRHHQPIMSKGETKNVPEDQRHLISSH